MRRVGDRFLLTGRERNLELDRLAVGLAESAGADRDLPARSAIQVFDNPDLGRFLLVIPDFDLKRFVQLRARMIDPERQAPPLADQVEGGAGERPDGLI